MSKIYEISQEVAELLKGKKYNDFMYFNPVQDDKNKWYITSVQVEKNEKEDIKKLLKNLKEKSKADFKPKKDFNGDN